jgi:TRAP-type C4-dicarboxylate transport system substrate-binding protein
MSFAAQSKRSALWPCLAAFAVALTVQAPAQAQEVIKLTAMDGYPAKAAWVREFINFYIPEIDKRLAAAGNYKIEWNQAWGGQIVKPKHVLEGLQKGLGDIGVVTTVFHHDKVPLQAIAYVTPFVSTDPGLVARTVDELADKYPAMKEAWADYNQVYLTNMVVFDSYQVFSKDPITKLGDFDGLKINGAGTNLRTLQSLGAAGVGGSLVTYYQNIKTGVVDGCLLWPEAAVTFKLYEVAPHMMVANMGAANSKAITVNKDTWERLPEEVRTVLAETAINYRDHMAKVAAEKGAKSYESFKAKGGTVTFLAEDQRAVWAKSMPNVAKEWAEGLEKKGLPGRSVLTDYMDKMRAGDQPISRQWDQE